MGAIQCYFQSWSPAHVNTNKNHRLLYSPSANGMCAVANGRPNRSVHQRGMQCTHACHLPLLHSLTSGPVVRSPLVVIRPHITII